MRLNDSSADKNINCIVNQIYKEKKKERKKKKEDSCIIKIGLNMHIMLKSVK